MANKIEAVKKNIENIKENYPLMYKEEIARGGIVDIEQQKKLSKMTSQEFHNYLIHRETFSPLNIYPEYVSGVMRNFNEDIFKILEEFNTKNENDLHQLERLTHFSFSIKKEPVAGPHFFVTTSTGYPQFLEFKEEEVWRIAPKEADAYVTGLCRIPIKVYSVAKDKKMADSPIIAGKSQRVDLKEGLYHIVSISFFETEKLSIRKYKAPRRTN
jgi:hypothetical protein